MRALRTCSLWLLLSGVASAQSFSAGIKGGIPLTDAFADLTTPGAFTAGQTVQTLSDSKKFAIGGTIELSLPLGFSIAADVLYRPLRLTTLTTNAGSTQSGKNSSNYTSLEVPILGKYRLPFTPLVKAYVEAGPSFRILAPTLYHFMSAGGVALGGGVEFKVSRFRISPEIRYTRWGGDSSSGALEATSNANQVELLIGVRL